MAAKQNTQVHSNNDSNKDNDELVLDEIKLNDASNVNNIIRRASITYIECNKDDITQSDEKKELENVEENEPETATLKHDSYDILELISNDNHSFLVDKVMAKISDKIMNELIETAKPSQSEDIILLIIENWFRTLNTCNFKFMIAKNLSQIIIKYYLFVLQIKLTDISGNALHKVVMFMEHYHYNGATIIEKPLRSASMRDIVSAWEASFVEVDQETLFEMILAANKLKIQPMVDLTCAKVASMIKGKSPEEIRKLFNIKNDFSPEEEEAVRSENRWATDP